jgi:hypothetical protein
MLDSCALISHFELAIVNKIGTSEAHSLIGAALDGDKEYFETDDIVAVLKIYLKVVRY